MVTDGTRSNCITNRPEPDHISGDTEITGRITCHATFSEFTIVHEFGHILAGRTGNVTLDSNSLYGLVRSPLPPNNAIRANGQILGPFSYSVNVPAPVTGPETPTPTPEYVSASNWQRGNRGWGSGSDLFTAPVYADVRPLREQLPLPTYPPLQSADIFVGPCGIGTGSTGPGLPTDFQQNPCQVKNWVVQHPEWYEGEFPDLGSTDIEIVEIDETAADMLLNWTYWQIGGFKDLIWTSAAQVETNAQIDTFGSGEIRYNWMNCAMTRLWNIHDFWSDLTDYPFVSTFGCERFSGLQPD